MSLQLLGHIELPGNLKPGGFDHAAVHCWSGRLSTRFYLKHIVQPFTLTKDRRLPQFLIRDLPTVTSAYRFLPSDELLATFIKCDLCQITNLRLTLMCDV